MEYVQDATTFSSFHRVYDDIELRAAWALQELSVRSVLTLDCREINFGACRLEIDVKFM